jgi:hypothetical protein
VDEVLNRLSMNAWSFGTAINRYLLAKEGNDAAERMKWAGVMYEQMAWVEILIEEAKSVLPCRYTQDVEMEKLIRSELARIAAKEGE